MPTSCHGNRGDSPVSVHFSPLIDIWDTSRKSSQCFKHQNMDRDRILEERDLAWGLDFLRVLWLLLVRWHQRCSPIQWIMTFIPDTNLNPSHLLKSKSLWQDYRSSWLRSPCRGFYGRRSKDPDFINKWQTREGIWGSFAWKGSSLQLRLTMIQSWTRLGEGNLQLSFTPSFWFPRLTRFPSLNANLPWYKKPDFETFDGRFLCLECSKETPCLTSSKSTCPIGFLDSMELKHVLVIWQDQTQASWSSWGQLSM